MNHIHRAVIQQLVYAQADLYTGSDFTTESLETSEYFRGQVELIADMVGGCDAKMALWEPLKAVCAASAAGGRLHGDSIFVFVGDVLDAAERHLEKCGAC